MKLKELIIKLKELENAGHGELEMLSEGCDCTGDVEDVSIYYGKVMLWRDAIISSEPVIVVNPPRSWTREDALAYAQKNYSTCMMSDVELDELVTAIYEQL